MKNIPEKIYLQIDPENEKPDNFNDLQHEVTWCQDRINNTDVEYIRKDKIREYSEND